jgi:hypothetical protein
MRLRRTLFRYVARSLVWLAVRTQQLTDALYRAGILDTADIRGAIRVSLKLRHLAWRLTNPRHRLVQSKTNLLGGDMNDRG